jgi:uncharacterized membrane protein
VFWSPHTCEDKIGEVFYTIGTKCNLKVFTYVKTFCSGLHIYVKTFFQMVFTYMSRQKKKKRSKTKIKQRVHYSMYSEKTFLFLICWIAYFSFSLLCCFLISCGAATIFRIWKTSHCTEWYLIAEAV